MNEMILFIDDEKRAVSSCISELEMSNYRVEFRSSVDDALEYLSQNSHNTKLVIMDIMMPLGKAFKSEPDAGLRTGMHLYDRIRETSTDVPIIVFTNVTDDKVREKFEKEPNCWFFQKTDLLPFELADEVSKILSNVIQKG